MHNQINKSSGFTLLEVMIALVIFSVGLLGLAGIQAIALKNNSTAYMRTIAMQQSYNMSDLIRAHKSADGSIVSTFSNLTTTLLSAPSKDCNADDNTTNCAPSEMAQFDIYHWQKGLELELPSGKGQVTLTGNIYEIIIMWDEENTGATGTDCGDDADVDLKCYATHIEV
jgi:type IV pilus assembly protein PilV